MEPVAALACTKFLSYAHTIISSGCQFVARLTRKVISRGRSAARTQFTYRILLSLLKGIPYGYAFVVC